MKTLWISTFLLLMTACGLAETNWSQWRGATGNGLSTAADVPQNYSGKDVIWKTELPGVGQSSRSSGKIRCI